MSSSIKLCCNCKYFKPINGKNFADGVCDLLKHICVITGKIDNIPAKKARKLQELCGKEAKYYQYDIKKFMYE